MTHEDAQNAEQVKKQVREGYASIASGTVRGCCGPSPCCGGEPGGLATQIGYAEQDLAGLPEGANMGLSCGNPTALASLKSGEVVLDLGSGGGFDCFIAGPKVGAAGRVIGVDMTPEMLSKARGNIAAYRQRTGFDNVEFRLGEIEHLPVADSSVDVVISNCVINLSPDKPKVWREMARVLKPGGRVAVSDLALLKPLPEEIREMVAALVGCIAGAVLVDETRRLAQEAGMVGFNDPLYQKIVAALPAGTKASDFVTSLDVAARKPL
jgi:arsenite methyltransferase